MITFAGPASSATPISPSSKPGPSLRRRDGIGGALTARSTWLMTGSRIATVRHLSDQIWKRMFPNIAALATAMSRWANDAGTPVRRH
ncbi:hypothetical protein MHPYR_90088 [uncultured Mycobacterium sp.]|uniref:Uncharacterized protein n=1 Tax=uncultured Mycobacterium sp. TaxID=171292 RepID=A0A1Y5PUZ7_9MYCO|nr:hypothetical protein MHPYR_90088 [uncultured Mycobacterium sp.]